MEYVSFFSLTLSNSTVTFFINKERLGMWFGLETLIQYQQFADTVNFLTNPRDKFLKVNFLTNPRDKFLKVISISITFISSKKEKKVKKFRGKRQYVVTYCLFPHICPINKIYNLWAKQRMFYFLWHICMNNFKK